MGQTQYFFTGRSFVSELGLENPTSSPNAIHDNTQQGKGFAYLSTVIDDSTRLSFIGGTSTSKYQIPNNPGQMPQFTAFGVSDFNSAFLNENQSEQNHFGVLALQKSINGFDLQLAAFSRYSSVHFIPDTVGDLVFNGVASGCVPPQSRQRHPGRRLLSPERCPYACARASRSPASNRRS